MQSEYHDDENDAAQAPSKSQRKRSHKALQDLGIALMRLSTTQLERVPLPGEVREAIVAGRSLRKGARARHVRHLGNLLAEVDEVAVHAALEGIHGASARDTAKLHRAERWRTRLLDEGDAALAQLLELFPHADRQQLRALLRTAHEERARAAPPRRQRELLRALRSLEEAAD